MSDDIPFDVLEKIIERLPVKSLLQWRSVSKAWKSLIDSAEFIARHSTRHAHFHRLLVRYETDPYNRVTENYKNYVSFVDNDTFPQQKFGPSVPASIELIRRSRIIGSSLGLLCLYGESYDYDSLFGRSKRNIAVIWNPSIRKHVDIDVLNVLGGKVYSTVLGFGVCPDTSDVKLVKITSSNLSAQTQPLKFIPWHVEVFTLSSGNWTSLCRNIPRESIEVTWSQVAIDGFIYWLAFDRIAKDDRYQTRNLIMSFDMTAEEFIEVSLPDSLALSTYRCMSISKLRESLVVLDYEYNITSDKEICSVWVMNHGVPTSFTKLFTIVVESEWEVLGFSKNGKLVMLMGNDAFGNLPALSNLVVYEPCSKNFEVVLFGQYDSFFVNSYVETLLLVHVPVDDED